VLQLIKVLILPIRPLGGGGGGAGGPGGGGGGGGGGGPGGSDVSPDDFVYVAEDKSADGDDGETSVIDDLDRGAAAGGPPGGPGELTPTTE